MRERLKLSKQGRGCFTVHKQHICSDIESKTQLEHVIANKPIVKPNIAFIV